MPDTYGFNAQAGRRSSRGHEQAGPPSAELQQPSVMKLSLRERQVLERLLDGKTNKEIGYNLRISPRTVEKHRHRLKEKLGANSLADIVRIGLELLHAQDGEADGPTIETPAAAAQTTLRVLVSYVSRNGVLRRMAEAVAEGAKAHPRTEVEVRRIAGIDAGGGGANAAAPLSPTDVRQLAAYDIILFGTPSRYGGMAEELRALFDRAMDEELGEVLLGKIGGAFCSAPAEYGDHDSVLRSLHTILLSFGMIPAGVPRRCLRGDLTEHVGGGTPYGATCLIGRHGPRGPNRHELAVAYCQGRHAANLGFALRRFAVAEARMQHSDHIP